MAKKRKYSSRKYNFPLPYTISAMYLFYGTKLLKNAGIWAKMPGDLQSRWQKAADNWHPLKITKEDLDRIDDASWTEIANHLSLDWEVVK